MVDETYDEAHKREQAEAAVAEAIDVIKRYSSNYLIFVRIGPRSQAFKISAANCTESVQLCSNASIHLNRFITDVALTAALAADDYLEEDGHDER